MRKTKRIMVIGLDAWAAPIVERLVEEGSLPTIRRLMEQGSYGRLTPFWTCATGNNWASIITGASPAKHQCDFNVWLPGRRLDQPQLGFPSHFCKAEQLWQTAGREGRVSVIFDYPQSYPINAENVIHIGEDGSPDNSSREVFAPWAYSTNPTNRRWHEVMSKIELRRPEGWTNLPASGDYLEAELELQPGVRSTHAAEDRMYVLLEKENGGGFSRMSFFDSARDYSKPLGHAHSGEWTDWMFAAVQTASGPVDVAFKAKVLVLDPSGEDLHIYLSQGYPTTGYTQPAGLSEELLAAVGPYQHHGHTQEWVFFGACDLQTQIEQVEAQSQWLRGAAGYVLDHYDWDLLALKWHDTDTFQHCAFQMIDPVHPLFDPEKEAEGWDLFRKVYGLGDKLVEELLQRAGEGTVVAVVSDHGQIANTYFPNMTQAFAEAGLCAWKEDGKPDLTQSKAVMTATGVHINVKGRYEGGIVELGPEYEEVCRRVMRLMREWRHPDSGEPAFQLVARKEDMGFMGIDGPQIGDIIYILNPIVPNRSYTEEEYEQLVMAGMWLTSRGTHGSHLPSQRFSLGGIEGICILTGPGVHPGRRAHTYWTNAVAPTVCTLADHPIPRDADGAVMWEAVER